MSTERRYDFVVTKLREGTSADELEALLVRELGAKPEKVRAVVAHIQSKGAVLIEKGVNKARLDELTRVWAAGGAATTANESLELVVEGAAKMAAPPAFKCLACGHEAAPINGDQCAKCGAFARKFLEQQKKKELYQREKEKLEMIHGLRRQREDKEAREAAERNELEAVRRQIEEEMGLHKKPGRWDWLTGGQSLGKGARVALGGTAAVVVLAGGFYARDLASPASVTREEIAKQQAAQSTQSANQMQAAVGQLIAGSKKMAQASGAADQLTQSLFAVEGRDLELQEQLQVAAKVSGDTAQSMVEVEKAASLAATARTFVDSGGELGQAEKALDASMQSARAIPDQAKRAETVSAVAQSQFEVHSQDARSKAAKGDWRAADKAFSKAMNAATDIATKSEAISTRASIARVRADTGDFGGATVLFLDAMKNAEELPDPRSRALAIADVAKTLAETTNDFEGAVERAFDKAMAAAAAVKLESERNATLNTVLQRRIEAECNAASFLYSTDAGSKQATKLLEQAAKGAEKISDALTLVRVLGGVVRVMAEYDNASAAFAGVMARVREFGKESSARQNELLAVAVARIEAETLAAGAKLLASRNNKAKAKEGFLAALKASNGIMTKSTDGAVRGEVAKQRTETLGQIARYMQAAGDRDAAARVFKSALESAGPAETAKVVSMVMRNR